MALESVSITFGSMIVIRSSNIQYLMKIHLKNTVLMRLHTVPLHGTTFKLSNHTVQVTQLYLVCLVLSMYVSSPSHQHRYNSCLTPGKIYYPHESEEVNVTYYSPGWVGFSFYCVKLQSMVLFSFVLSK